MARVRIADLSDARELAQLAEKTFRDAFAAQNTAENMDVHCQSTYGEDIQAREISSADYHTLVVEEKEGLIAYAQLRWVNPPDCVTAASPGEILRLYVDRHWHGRGVAHQLMAACLDNMVQRNSDIVWLGVWEHNPRAITFYRKFGFVTVGEHIYPVGQDPQRDIILARPARTSVPEPGS